jgi:hypothetical protein
MGEFSDHTVQLYQDEADVVDALERFVAGGLTLGQGVVMIGSRARWHALTARLRAGGIDTHAAMLRGQLRLFGAGVILSSCVSRAAFNEAIGQILALVRMRYAQLRVFSGLSDLLWSEGKREVAETIERFWNTLPDSSALSLLCACPLDSLDGRAYDGALQSVCALHTHLVPARDCNAFNEAVGLAIREVLEPQLVGMLHALSTQNRPGTQMPTGQAVILWLRQHMPRTAEKVLARARANSVAT